MMNSESQTSSENLRFTEDAHHILESLLKGVHRAQRQKNQVEMERVRSLLEDLITFAEYQGYDAIWRSLLRIREMTPQDTLDELGEFIAGMLEELKTSSDAIERPDRSPAPGRKSLLSALRAMDPEMQSKITHVLEIHLDIFNNLVHNLTDNAQRAVYLDSLDNCIFSLRDIELAPVQEILNRHRSLLADPLEPSHIKEIRTDLRALGQLIPFGPSSVDMPPKSKPVDVRTVLPDLQMIMHNIRHLINRVLQSKRTKGLAEPWRANINELLKILRKLSIDSPQKALDHLDQQFKDWDEDSPSLLDDFLHFGRVLAVEADIVTSSLIGHDHVAYHDLASWPTEKQLYRLLDTEYILQNQILVDSERVPEIIDIAADLTTIRSSIHDVSEKMRADLTGVRASRLLDELNSQLTKVTRRLIKTTDLVYRIDGQFLLNRLDKELAHCAKRNRGVCQAWLQNDDVRMDLTLIEDLEDPLLELLRQTANHVILEKDSISLELTLSESKYAYNLVIREREGHPAWMELLANLTTSARTRAERLEAFVRGTLGFRHEASDAIGDFVQRGLDRLRCDIEITPSDWTLRIPKRHLFSTTYVIKSDDEIYLMPVDAVLDNRSLSEDQLMMVHGQRMLRYEGRLIVAIALNSLVHPDQAAGGHQLLIVDTPGKPTGLLVDQIVGTEEVAIKPLDEALRAGRIFSGGAVLGDGNIGLMVDPIELGELSTHTEASVRQFLETQQVN